MVAWLINALISLLISALIDIHYYQVVKKFATL
jgi:hypothetical protein